MKLLCCFTLILILYPAIVVAEVNISEEKLNVKILTARHIGLNPMIINAVNKQNNEKLTIEKIRQIDKQWKSSKRFTAFKLSLQHNDAGLYLKSIVKNNPNINEAFLTDSKGANVAAYPVTSDYWQGDEEKWQASFNSGQGKVFIGPPKIDESTNVAAVQISAPVIDYLNDRKTIGVIVLGVTVDYLKSN